MILTMNPVARLSDYYHPKYKPTELSRLDDVI